MRKNFKLLLSLFFCVAVVTLVYVKEAKCGWWERKSEERIEKRTDRATERKTERRQERHPEATGEMIEKRGERRQERQDKYLGEEAAESRREKRPQRKAVADIDGDGTISKQEWEDYKGSMKTTHEEIKGARRDLGIEHLDEYKGLHSKYDTDGDGVLDKDEWDSGKKDFRDTFGAHVAEDIEMYKVHKEKRDSLLGDIEE